MYTWFKCLCVCALAWGNLNCIEAQLLCSVSFNTISKLTLMYIISLHGLFILRYWLLQTVGKLLKVQAYLILLRFILLHFADAAFFLQIDGLWLTLCQASLSAPIFEQHLLTLCHMWLILTLFQAFSSLLYLLKWYVIRDYDLLTAQMMVSIF